MDRTLVSFVHALRGVDVSVSPAETLAAASIWETVGVRDKTLLHDALAMALAKSKEDKARFSICFATFFSARMPAADHNPSHDEATFADSLAFLKSSGYAVAADTLQQVGDGQLATMLWSSLAQKDTPRLTALRDKTRFRHFLHHYLGLDELAAAWREAQTSEAFEMADRLGFAQQRLQAAANAWLDIQFEVQGDHRQIQRRIVTQGLAHLPPDYDAQMRAAIAELAARLKRQRSKQRKVRQRRHLHVPSVLRASVAYDGVPMKLFFQPRRRRTPSVFVVCDVSGSMARLARFFLLLLHQLHSEIASVRCFVFSSELGEITESLPTLDSDTAYDRVLAAWGYGTTDYGNAIEQFNRLTEGAVKAQSTVIILGDGRNNLMPGKFAQWRRLAQRCGTLIWLNPEPPHLWGTGDSLMSHYAAYAHQVRPLRHLQDLENVVRGLLDP